MNQENQKKQFGWPSRLFILLFTLACLPMAPVRSNSQPVEASAEKRPGGDLNRLLTEDQRAFNEWTEKSFRSFFDQRSFPTLTPAEREQMEAKLIDTLSGPKSREYYMAINTLAALKSKKAIPALVKIATDRNEGNCRDRWMAIRALGLIGDTSVVPDLIHLVYYPNTNTHYMAQIALVRLTGQNFGLDYKKWVAWWNAQGKEPKLSEEQIPWVKEAKYLDLNSIRESDRAFMEKLKEEQSGKPAASASGQPTTQAAAPPRIVSTSPMIGSNSVDPSVNAITVTFDRDMATNSWSWTGGGPSFPPSPKGKKPYWHDARTAILPVQLESGHFYRVGINAQSFHGFQSADGMPVEPAAIYFTTRGAGADQEAMNHAPKIVAMEPKNGAKGVDPNLKELRVTFNVPMGGGFSWCGGGPNFPEGPDGARPAWSADRKTCTLPVTLKPNWKYRLGLNSPSFKNFQSAGGVPLDPVVYSFETGQ